MLCHYVLDRNGTRGIYYIFLLHEISISGPKKVAILSRRITAYRGYIEAVSRFVTNVIYHPGVNRKRERFLKRDLIFEKFKIESKIVEIVTISIDEYRR